MEVTKQTVMQWDDYNRRTNRYHVPRKDESIYVSISTYRDVLCPSTLKSMFKQASDSSTLYVGLFQQNCFEEKCRTGVLEGGKVEEAGTDMNCYTEFCNSDEGIKSNACNTGQIRLFNVNEAQSLG